PFDVIIEDISGTGARILHEHPMDAGMTLLLTVPAGDEGQTELRQYTVARCSIRGDAKYAIGLDLKHAPEPTPAEPKRVCSKRLKILFLLFGIFGLFIATFAPL